MICIYSYVHKMLNMYYTYIHIRCICVSTLLIYIYIYISWITVFLVLLKTDFAQLRSHAQIGGEKTPFRPWEKMRMLVSVSISGPSEQMGVSKYNGTPKSSILIGFSIINHPFWGTPILETPKWWLNVRESPRSVIRTPCLPDGNNTHNGWTPVQQLLRIAPLKFKFGKYRRGRVLWSSENAKNSKRCWGSKYSSTTVICPGVMVYTCCTVDGRNPAGVNNVPDNPFFPWVLYASAAGFLPSTVSPKKVCFNVFDTRPDVPIWNTVYVCCCCLFSKGQCEEK